MADTNYDERAEEERTPATDSVSNNQTSPGNAGYTSGNPYARSLRNREKKAGRGAIRPYDSRAGNPDAAGASSQTHGLKADAQRLLKESLAIPSLEEAASVANDEFGDDASNIQTAASFFKKDEDGDRHLLRKAGTGVARKYTKYYLITGIIGGIISLIVTAIFILIPLKIESLVTDLDSHFMSTAINANETETDNLFSSYMTDHVLPALKACGARSTAVIDRHCNAYLNNTFTGGTSNPVHALWRGWRNGNLENKLATKYGIEFQLDKSANGLRSQWYLKTPETTGQGDPIGDDGQGLAGEFHKADRIDMEEAIKSQTQWYNVMTRFKVGRLLEEKYGIKRCIIYCGVRYSLDATKSNIKYAAKMYLIERVAQPRSAALAQVLGCILVASSGCDGKATTTECAETGSTCAELGGEGESVAAANIEEAVAASSSEFGSETAAQLIKLISNVREAGGAQTYVINKVIGQFLSQDGEEDATIEVPVVGELNMMNQALYFISAAGTAGYALQHLSYLVNSQAAVSMSSMYTSYADEIHTGHVNATEVGSFNTSLGPGDQCSPAIEKCGSTPVDGTAGAEDTPLYSSLIQNNPNPVGASTYKCNNGKSVPRGKLVCPEEVLGAKNQTVSSIDNTLKKSGVLPLAQAYEHSPIAAVFNAVSSASSYIIGPALQAGETAAAKTDPSLVNKAKAKSHTIFTDLVNQIVPSPFSQDESGGRNFDMIAAGKDVTGSDYTHTGLGGQQITPAVAASITQQQENQAQAEFQSQPLFARLFSTDTPYSLISKLAVDIPFGVSTDLQDGFASLLNPLSALSSSFGSLFWNKADAAATPQADPFGVTQYGYPPGSIPSDPETYWQNNCTNNPAQAYENNANYAKDKWNDPTTIDPENGQPVSTTVNPCLLIESSVGSAGAVYDSSTLTSDDLADVNSGSSSSSSSGSIDCTSATGNPKILCEAEQYNGIYYLGGGGHQGYPAFSQACSSSVLASAASTSTISNPGPCATDCSGLVSVAASEAFGQNFSWTVGTLETDTTDWKPISITSVQPGDVVTQGTDTHVEIVNHYDASTKTMYTFGSHAPGQQTSVLTWPLSAWTGAYTYIGPGNS